MSKDRLYVLVVHWLYDAAVVCLPQLTSYMGPSSPYENLALLLNVSCNSTFYLVVSPLVVMFCGLLLKVGQ